MKQISLIQLRPVRNQLQFITAIARDLGYQSRRMRLAKRRKSGIRVRQLETQNP